MIPIIRSDINLEYSGVCYGTIYEEPCQFSRRSFGEPVSNTGMRCVWCRPNLTEALGRPSARQKLRKAFDALPREFQLILQERLPGDEQSKWTVKAPEIQHTIGLTSDSSSN